MTPPDTAAAEGALPAIRLLYFAWVRERIGVAEEEASLPESVGTVAGLLDWLAQRGSRYSAALAERSRIRVAVNQQFADGLVAVRPGDEVAIFPPVTGG